MITSSRADYGLLRPLLSEISRDKKLHLQLIVSGMHLASSFGLTYREIESDGFKIDERIDISLTSDGTSDIARSMGIGLRGFVKAYQRLKPDICVVLGDRFEIFTAAVAALISRIPLAHLYGGEVTAGAFDDAFRHSITKMSHLHFTATERYRQRIIQLGESPKRVFSVGALGLDNIEDLKLLSKKEIEEKFGFKFKACNLLITFQPVTLEEKRGVEEFGNLLGVLDSLKDTLLIFTKANADPGGRAINKMIDRYVTENREKAVVFASLGHLNYLSIMRYTDGVIGNSSSGIIEAAVLRIGTVNIGDRQRGRIRLKSIIDCAPTKDELKKAIKRLYSSQFRRGLKNLTNPYGTKDVAKKIKDVLKNWRLRDILKKDFYDL